MGERKSKKIDVSEVETLVASRGQDIPLPPPTKKKSGGFGVEARKKDPLRIVLREKKDFSP